MIEAAHIETDAPVYRSEHWLTRLGLTRWLGHAGLWIGASMVLSVAYLVAYRYAA